MPRVVKVKATGKTIYRQQPDFDPGMGIKSACALYGYQDKDLEEIELAQEKYDADIQAEVSEIEKERMIGEEMKSVLREQAIQNLKAKGKI